MRNILAPAAVIAALHGGALGIRRLARARDLPPLQNLPALLLGLLYGLLLPAAAAGMVEPVMGAVLMFCTAWLGIAFGCSLNIRTPSKAPGREFVLHTAAAAVLALSIAAAGMALRSLVPGLPLTPAGVLSVAAFGSLSLFTREPSMKSPSLAILRHVPGATGNLLPLLLLGIAGSLSHSGPPLLFNIIDISGIAARLFAAVVMGLSLGMLMAMFARGTYEGRGIQLITAGGAALVGGTAFALGISPLITGTVAGAALINSTLNRRIAADEVSNSIGPVELVLLFLVGMFSARLVLSAGIVQTVVIALSAAGFVLMRNGAAHGFLRAWTLRLQPPRRGTRITFLAITAQGALPAAALMEYQLGDTAHGAVFLFLVAALALQRTITIAGLRTIR